MGRQQVEPTDAVTRSSFAVPTVRLALVGFGIGKAPGWGGITRAVRRGTTTSGKLVCTPGKTSLESGAFSLPASTPHPVQAIRTAAISESVARPSGTSPLYVSSIASIFRDATSQ